MTKPAYRKMRLSIMALTYAVALPAALAVTLAVAVLGMTLLYRLALGAWGALQSLT